MFGKLGMVPDGDHNDIYENMCQRLHLCTSLQVHARNGLLRSWGLACNTLLGAGLQHAPGPPPSLWDRGYAGCWIWTSENPF